MEVFKGDIKSLKEIVSHNIPVIVLINCEGGWHYVPVVGFDKKYIYLQDSVPKFRNVTGQKYNRKETYKKFEKLWNKAVEDGVQKKTAGKTMTDPSSRDMKVENKASTHDLLYKK